MCGEEHENLDHLFLCPFTWSLWFASTQGLRTDLLRPHIRWKQLKITPQQPPMIKKVWRSNVHLYGGLFRRWVTFETPRVIIENLDPLLNPNPGRLLLLLRTFLFDNSKVTMIENLNSGCLENIKSYQPFELQGFWLLLKTILVPNKLYWNHTDLRT